MPLESIWEDLLRKDCAKNESVSNVEQLWQQISCAWSSMFDDHYVDEIINQIPKSLRSIIANDGECASANKNKEL